MRRKRKKREVDELLLHSIFKVEHEWKQVQSLIKRSIEPTMDGASKVAIAQAKYIFLLREAKVRKISAIRYSHR